MAKRRVALTPLCGTLKTIRKTGGTLRCCLAKRGREYPKDSSDAKEIEILLVPFLCNISPLEGALEYQNA